MNIAVRRILIRHGVLHLQALAHATLARSSPIAMSSLALRWDYIAMSAYSHQRLGFLDLHKAVQRFHRRHPAPDFAVNEGTKL